MSRILTAYFSASGNTKRLAKTIAEVSGSDLFEIAPKTPYTEADLNWMDKKSRSSVEMKDKSFRPEIAEKVKDPDVYDVFIIGFPIWWYEAPRIIQTFLEEYDFSGKSVAIFATSGGSGMGKTNEILKASCSSKVKWLGGRKFGSNTDKQTIENWLDSLDL